MKKKYLMIIVVSIVVMCLSSAIYHLRRNGVPKANVSVAVYKNPELPENWGDPLNHLSIWREVNSIDGACVTIYNGNFQVAGITNENGLYYLAGLNTGQYQIKINVDAIGETENSIIIRGGEWEGKINGVIVDVLYVESENKWYWYSEEIAVS